MKKKASKIVFYIIPFAILIFMLMLFYPGVATYDGYSQWNQVQSKIISDAHPFFSTYFMYMLSKIYNSMTTVIIFQILLFSIIWGYFCNTIKATRKKDFYIKIIFTVFLCFSPLIGIYNITLWKDILYTDYLFLAGLILYSWAKNKFNFPIYKYVLLGLIFILVFSYRHNGVIVSVLLMIMFYIICLIKYKSKFINKKEFLKSFSTLITFLLLFSLILIPKTLYINKYNEQEKKKNEISYSTLDGYVLWMMGAHLKNNNINNKDDLKFLNNIIPIAEWKRIYDPCLINNIGSSENLDKKYLVDNTKKLRYTFIKYSKKNPGTILKHYLIADGLLINPISHLYGYVYVYSFPELIHLSGYEIKSIFPKLENIYMRVINVSITKPFIMFYQPALILYITILLALLLIKKLHEKKYWFILLPMIMNTASLLPINLAQDLRYVYINYLTFFAILLIFILNFHSIFKFKKYNNK